MKKILLLFLGLALPALVFVFLKVFGRNEFDVPVMHQDSVSAQGCHHAYRTPYVIADSIQALLGIQQQKLTIIAVGRPGKKLQDVVRDYSPETKLFQFDELQLEANEKKIVQECVLLIEMPADIVMVDSGGRIRGYYVGSDRDELDRLDAELKIILKRY